MQDSVKVMNLLNQSKPCLILVQCDVTTLIPKREVYLVDLHMLGTINQVHDDAHMCEVEITAVDLDYNESCRPLGEVMREKEVATVKKID